MNAPDSAEIRVLVVAGYPSARAGLRAMLDGRPGIVVVGETASLGERVEFGEDAADVIVLEADRPVARWLGDIQLPAVVVGTDPSVFAGFDPARPGARLLRDADGDAIAAAVTAAAHGLVVTDPALVLAPERSIAENAGVLSARETAVLRLVAAGLPNKGIARELGISEHTVKFHVASLLGKLGAASRAEAVATAARQGLLPL